MLGSLRSKLPHTPDHVLGGHFAVALVELDAFVQMEGPRRTVFPAFGQHRDGFQVAADGQERFADWSGLQHKDLRVARQGGVAHEGPEFLLTDCQAANGLIVNHHLGDLRSGRGRRNGGRNWHFRGCRCG